MVFQLPAGAGGETTARQGGRGTGWPLEVLAWRVCSGLHCVPPLIYTLKPRSSVSQNVTASGNRKEAIKARRGLPSGSGPV